MLESNKLFKIFITTMAKILNSRTHMSLLLPMIVEELPQTNLPLRTQESKTKSNLFKTTREPSGQWESVGLRSGRNRRDQTVGSFPPKSQWITGREPEKLSRDLWVGAQKIRSRATRGGTAPVNIPEIWRVPKGLHPSYQGEPKVDQATQGEKYSFKSSQSLLKLR